VKILLDTHCLLWAMAEPERLGNKARALLENRNTQLYLSVASSWEIAIKAKLGKIPLPQTPDLYIADVINYLNLIPLEINNNHVLQTYFLPAHHQDSFDRLLIAQSRVEKLALMTTDRQFRTYEVELIWGRD
jgi:PIN domain nuclease of toxin-antitoxin system